MSFNSGVSRQDDEVFRPQNYAVPQDGMEDTLAGIWSELLGIDRVSRHDNFFALGGNSLSVIQLLSQLRQIGFDTTAQVVFDVPNLTALAAKLDQYKPLTVPPNLVTGPETLLLIDLSQADIHTIIAQVAGAVANIQDIYGLSKQLSISVCIKTML